ncbi:DUF3575 domain-containing protein [Hymenobacter gummosus]|uniref:DUF3575 domain-containing protein n=1 Tax=Hymenobacter gummosus TaxID=1776032 RepID=A0A431U250_9BACT|nr:DUF3575 domain-containing protein [Hymenobacter gummosus]RTQ49288.1 DUF3575 domain-containing protein [Hymenobacter gummosus]
MKHAVLALMLLAGSATTALAQRTHAIKLNVLSTGVRTASLFYEHKVRERGSAQLGLALTSLGSGDNRLSGVTLTPEYRFYLSGQALDGFYVAPFVRFRSFKMTAPSNQFDQYGNPSTEIYTGRTQTFGGGVVAGYQWLISERLTLDVYGGLSHSFSSFSSKEGISAGEFDDYSRLSGVGLSFSRMFSNTGLRSGFTFGVAF